MNALSNRQPMLDTLNATLRELGRESVKSALAKPSMALAVIKAAKEGLISQDDAGSVYAEYLAGREYAIGRNTMAVGTEDNAKSIAANTSKVRSQIAAAIAAPDFPATVAALIDLRAEIKKSGGDVKDVYQAIYDASVQQNKNTDTDLDMDALDAIVRKKAKDEKSELDKMTDEYKRLYKLAFGTEESAPIDAMMPVFEVMRDVLEGNGIALPAMTADEKKAEKAMKFLRSTGRI